MINVHKVVARKFRTATGKGQLVGRAYVAISSVVRFRWCGGHCPRSYRNVVPRVTDSRTCQRPSLAAYAFITSVCSQQGASKSLRVKVTPWIRSSTSPLQHTSSRGLQSIGVQSLYRPTEAVLDFTVQFKFTLRHRPCWIDFQRPQCLWWPPIVFIQKLKFWNLSKLNIKKCSSLNKS